MPRYVVERNFTAGLIIPTDPDGAKVCSLVVSRNAEDQVTWVHSYVSKDKSRTYCVYDAPSPEAIRTVAKKNSLPVGSNITLFPPRNWEPATASKDL